MNFPPKIRAAVLLLPACLLLAPSVRAASIGFEPGEGFAVDSDVATAAGWTKSTSGAAKISTDEAQSGQQSLKIAASKSEAAATTTFPIPDDGIAFLDFAILPTADGSKTPLSTIDANGAVLGFLEAKGEGRVVAVITPNAKGDPTNSVDAGYVFGLSEQGVAKDWIRVTIREDLKRKTWDLYLDGKLTLIDQPLATESGKTGALSLEANSVGDAYVDALSIAGVNPLFADWDKDGIPDAEEMAEGTNPYFDDRETDFNGNGKSNLRDFLSGSSFTTLANSKNVARRIVYVDGRNGDDRFTGASSYRVGIQGKGGDGPKATLPEAIRENDADVHFALLPSDKPYSLVERAPGTENTIYLIPLGDVHITTEKKSQP